MRGFKSLAAVLAGGCLMLSSVVFASGMKTFPGSMCGSTSATQPTINSNAEARNSTTSTSTFVCPLMREEANLVDQATGNVWVNDLNYDVNVCCSMRSKDPGGQPVIFTANQCTAGVISNDHLDFVSLIPSGSWSTRFFVCSVPATYSGNASAILSYRAEQL